MELELIILFGFVLALGNLVTLTLFDMSASDLKNFWSVIGYLFLSIVISGLLSLIIIVPYSFIREPISVKSHTLQAGEYKFVDKRIVDLKNDSLYFIDEDYHSVCNNTDASTKNLRFVIETNIIRIESSADSLKFIQPTPIKLSTTDSLKSTTK